MLNSLFEKHEMTVEISVEGIVKTRISDFESVEELLSAKDLMALSLKSMTIRARSRDASVDVTFGGWSSGEMSVYSRSLEDAGKLLEEAETSVRAMRSERRWPHYNVVKYPAIVALCLVSVFSFAYMVYLSLGKMTEMNGIAIWFLGFVPVYHLSEEYKKWFPESRFLIGKQVAPPKWPVFVAGSVFLPLLVTIVYDVWLKRWLGIN